MTFEEAVQAVKSGLPVRRAVWPETQTVKASSAGNPVVVGIQSGKVRDVKAPHKDSKDHAKEVHQVKPSPAEKPYEWTDEDKAATDWIAA